MKRKKRAVTAVKIIILALLLFLALFPIYWLVSMAIRPMSEMKGHISLIPHTLTGEHFLTYRLASQAGSWAGLITFYPIIPHFSGLITTTCQWPRRDAIPASARAFSEASRPYCTCQA
jgi:ABC-type glycerol-3-phosphate transport system permease component